MGSAIGGVRWPVLAVYILMTTLAAGQGASRPSSLPVPPEPKLRIELKTDTPVVKAGESPRFSAELINDGEQPVAVVLPGDGSESAWRTPVVKWDPPPPVPGMRCGMFSRLKATDVALLEPGSRTTLEWIDHPALRSGKNTVSLEIENVPEINVRDFDEPTQPIPKDVLATPRFTARSNVVEIEVKGDPYRENGEISPPLLDMMRQQNKWRIEAFDRDRSDDWKLHVVEHQFGCMTRAEVDQIIAWGASKGYRASEVVEHSGATCRFSFGLIKNVPLTMERITADTTSMLGMAITCPVKYADGSAPG